MIKEARSMFASIFGGSKQKDIFYENFRLLNDFDNVFTNLNGQSYDDATVRQCIDRIATHAAKLKPKHMRKTNGRLEARESVLNSLLQFRPNAYMNTYDFLYKIVSQLYSNNNAFVYISTDAQGNATGLHPLNFADITLKEHDNQLYCQFNFYNTGRITVLYQNLIHLRRHFNREDFFGESNEKPLKLPLKILHTVKQALENAAKNSTKLRGYIKFLANIPDEDIKSKTDDFAKRYLDSTTSSGIGAVDNKSEFHQLTSDIKTADNEQMKFCREDIYNYFGVSEKIIKGNYTEAEFIAFFESVIEPIAIQLHLEFTAKLFTERERGHGNEIIFEANRLQCASLRAKLSMCQALSPQGMISINEVREVFGWAGIEGGDIRQVSLNYVNADKQDKYQLGESEKPKKEGEETEQDI